MPHRMSAEASAELVEYVWLTLALTLDNYVNAGSGNCLRCQQLRKCILTFVSEIANDN